jgi:YHS domain-containing protein/uncharacterized membrane protein
MLDTLLQFFGRTHPMVLHLPIGLLFALGAIEGIALFRREAPLGGVRRSLAWLVAISAVIAALSGLSLSTEEGYLGETLFQHKVLGIAMSVVALFVALLSHHSAHTWARRLYVGALLLALALVVPAGHLGASMTHGDDFLFAPFRTARATPAPSGSPGLQTPYALTIAPILERSCVGCHGESKKKGGLGLHTPEAIVYGGNGGEVIAAGDASSSEIIRRLRLPLDDDEHMPPPKKPQLAERDVLAIEAWVNSGDLFGESAPTRAGGAPKESAVGAPVAPIPAKIPHASPEAFKALADALVFAAPVESGSELLTVDFSAVARALDDERIAGLLTRVREQAHDVSLARAPVGERTLRVLRAMPNLSRLNLAECRVNDEALAILSGHPTLRELVVAQGAMTDASVASLIGLPALARVFIWQSGLSPEGIQKLRDARGALGIDTGEGLAAKPLESEGDLKFTGDRVLPGQAPIGAASIDLKPSNAVCPVSGKPVEPKYTVLYKSKLVGFCCQHCAASFWEAPEKYEGKLGG